MRRANPRVDHIRMDTFSGEIIFVPFVVVVPAVDQIQAPDGVFLNSIKLEVTILSESRDAWIFRHRQRFGIVEVFGGEAEHTRLIGRDKASAVRGEQRLRNCLDLVGRDGVRVEKKDVFTFDGLFGLFDLRDRADGTFAAGRRGIVCVFPAANDESEGRETGQECSMKSHEEIISNLHAMRMISENR